jgi:5-methylcytosine-specific restriction endonuclease McrA
MRKIGKKGLEWIRERKKRLKELEATGEYIIEGTSLIGSCCDCGLWRTLDFDHKEGRGGDNPHRMENLDAICRECHINRHNNMSKDKKNNKNSKSKKASWMKDHECKSCKKTVSTIICGYCGKMSV